MGTMAQSSELGLGPYPRTLVNPRRQTWLGDLHCKPYHRRQRKEVLGVTSPWTLKIRSKCIFKLLKHTSWTREREENSKYLRKGCHHHIKCTIAAFLATLMWRKPLNSTVLVAATHKGLKGVSDGMGAQVGVQVTNKCKVQMIRNSLYNVKKLL